MLDDSERLEGTASVTLRCIIGGVLMGLANLVPGISGGTMLLAAGIYPPFIESVANLSTLRFSKRALLVLGLVGGAAATAILLGAGFVKDAVVDHRWVMYSIFIGLTLGGIPVLWTLARPVDRSFWKGCVGGLFVMVFLALEQGSGDATAITREGPAIMVIAGAAGASAMILPGISGGYLLLIIGVYLPLLGAIDAFRSAIQARDFSAAMDPAVEVLVPVAIGVAIGVVVVSNALKIVLKKYEQPTFGVLMGFLLGAVVGLWPFQRGVPPNVGDVFRGVIMTPEAITALRPEKYPTEFYAPSPTDVIAALILIAAGFTVTALIAKFGSNPKPNCS